LLYHSSSGVGGIVVVVCSSSTPSTGGAVAVAVVSSAVVSVAVGVSIGGESSAGVVVAVAVAPVEKGIPLSHLHAVSSLSPFGCKSLIPAAITPFSGTSKPVELVWKIIILMPLPPPRGAISYFALAQTLEL
jgi:hypothetical protein